MPFKVHLLIVTCIIAAVYLVWEVMHSILPPPQAQSENLGIPHQISVIHASYGLNCRSISTNGDNTSQSPPNDTKKLSEDNVLAAVSQKCNGARQCEIALNDPVLGEDPAPSCIPKTLDIEYRCFSYDRPWRVHGSSGSLKLLCPTDK